MAGPSFTRPTELPEWATDDVNLPTTGRPNKETVSLALRRVGIDELQVPTAEYENSWRNNVWCWSGYLDQQITQINTSISTINDRIDNLDDDARTLFSIDQSTDLSTLNTVAQSVVDAGGTAGYSNAVTLTVNNTSANNLNAVVTFSGRHGTLTARAGSIFAMYSVFGDLNGTNIYHSGLTAGDTVSFTRSITLQPGQNVLTLNVCNVDATDPSTDFGTGSFGIGHISVITEIP